MEREDSVLAIVLEALGRFLRGEGVGIRLRVKPSWSGRVYGTWHLGGRHFLLALVFAATTGALFLRLLERSLGEPPGPAEAAALRRSSAHAIAVAQVRQPARVREFERVAEELYAHSHRLHTITGLPGEERSAAGLGRFAEPEEARRAGSLASVAADVAVLERHFARLDEKLRTGGDELKFTPSIVPVFQADFVPTSPFGRRVSPFTRLPEFHRGQDLAAEMYTKLVATADGTVVHVERDAARSRMGRYLVLDHGGRYQTYYGHCERVFVEVGETVRRHQIVAEVGNTGRSTGPHVHYEVRVAGEPRDPRTYFLTDPQFGAEDTFRFD